MKPVVLAIATTSLLLGGCVQLGRTARVDPARIAAHKPPAKCGYISGVGSDFKYAIDLDCFTFQAPPGDVKPTAYDGAYDGRVAIDESKHTAYSLAKSDAKYRNRLESVLLSQADAICEKEKGHIFANEAGIGVAFDTLASGFSGAATIVTGEQAKSILSGLAGLSTATRSHVTANIYKNQIVPAITNVMDAERTRLLTEIIALRNVKIEDYSADDMVRRVNRYNQACSFQFGIQLLLQASENKAGTDAIIRSINLRHAISELQTGRAKLVAAGVSTEAADKKLAELVLQLAETANATQSVTVTEGATPATNGPVSAPAPVTP